MENISNLLEKIVGIVADHLPERPGRVVISPGSPAWDDCGCDGQPGFLAIRLTGVSPNYPSNGWGQCSPPSWTLTVAVTLLECVESLNSNGIPTAEAITNDGKTMFDAMQGLLQILVCQVQPEVSGLEIGSWTPLDPQGGCAGGEWSFSIRIVG